MINPFFYGGWKYYINLGLGSKVLYFGRPEGVFAILSEQAEVWAVTPDDVSREMLDESLRSYSGAEPTRARCLSYNQLGSLEAASFDAVVFHGLNEWNARRRAVNPGFSESSAFTYAARALKEGAPMLVTASGFSLAKAYFLSRYLGLGLRSVLTFKDALYGPSLYSIEAASDGCGAGRLLRCAYHALRGGGFGLIFSSRHGMGESLLSRIVREHTHAAPPDRTQIYHGSGGVYTLLTDTWVYRMPQFEASESRCAVNYAALQKLRNLDLPFRCPEPGGHYRHNGKSVYTESRLPGRGVEYLSTSEDERAVRAHAALRALAALQKKTLRETRPDDPSILESLEKTSALEPYLSSGLIRALGEYRGAFSAAHNGEPLQRCLSHGDFKIANTLWDEDGKLSGVIDWDLSAADNDPLIDYLTYDAFDRSAASGKNFCGALAAARFEDFEKSAYRKECSGLITNPVRFRASVVWALLHYGTTHLQFLREDLKTSWYREQLGGPLREAIDAFLGAAGRRHAGAQRHV